MKLFHLHFGKDGGAERFFVNLLNSLQEHDVEQTIFIRPDRRWRSEIKGGVEIHEGIFRRLSISRFFLAAKLNRLLREQKPDGIMAWMPRGSRFTPAWPKCLKIARLGDYPPHLNYFTNIDILVCNTPGIAGHVRELGWARRVEVISNFAAVRAGLPISRDEMSTPPDAFVILGVGRFVRRKGFHTLIEALATLTNAYLWMVGDGEERMNLIQLAKTSGVSDRIRFVGWKSDPSPYLAACDVLCIPSLHEPLGNVILEAWAAGKPVVSSRSEGPTWMIRDGADGLLFDIEDATGLGRAIARLQESPLLREVITQGGGKTLASKFSKQSITDAYIKLFGDTVKPN